MCVMVVVVVSMLQEAANALRDSDGSSGLGVKSSSKLLQLQATRPTADLHNFARLTRDSSSSMWQWRFGHRARPITAWHHCQHEEAAEAKSTATNVTRSYYSRESRK